VPKHAEIEEGQQKSKQGKVNSHRQIRTHGQGPEIRGQSSGIAEIPAWIKRDNDRVKDDFLIGLARRQTR
jgi:hypothetical protein